MKNSLHRPLNQQGYTLIELSLVAAIIMSAGIFFLRLSGSIAGRGQYTTTDNRMRVIEAKIRQYYLAHEQLPAAANNEIPVDITALDLEQKYRLDGWGHYFQYTPGNVTNLQDILDTAGNPRAAAIISGGPDQNITTTSDNITKYLDLSVEAGQIVQKKLKVFREKVATYDALFAGVNNNGASVQDQTIDENPIDATEMDTCYQPAEPNPNPGCPPISGFCNDPATGLPTLDSIEVGMDANIDVYSCAAGNQLAFHLATYYRLPTGFPGGYDVDPWGNPFRWGCLGCGLTFDASYTITSTIPDTMDFHYHKFFSSGPDTTTVKDDIIYNGK